MIGNAGSTLLAWAAKDPDVVAIKQILSSVSGPLVQELVDAAESGKDVLVVLTGEIRDGQLLAGGTTELAEAGVLVIRSFGPPLLQPETTLLVRRETNRLRTYVAVSPANGGECVLSSDAKLAHDVSAVFNDLTGGTWAISAAPTSPQNLIDQRDPRFTVSSVDAYA